MITVTITRKITALKFELRIYRIEYRSDDVTKMIFLKLWDMMSYSYRGS